MGECSRPHRSFGVSENRKEYKDQLKIRKWMWTLREVSCHSHQVFVWSQSFPCSDVAGWLAEFDICFFPHLLAPPKETSLQRFDFGVFTSYRDQRRIGVIKIIFLSGLIYLLLASSTTLSFILRINFSRTNTCSVLCAFFSSSRERLHQSDPFNKRIKEKKFLKYESLTKGTCINKKVK